VLKGILKQHTIPRIGGLKETLAQVLFWGTPVNFVLIAMTFYFTTLRYICPWFSPLLFVIIILVGVLIISIIEFKWVIPSIWAFRSRQMFEHESQLMDKVASIETLLKGKAKKPHSTVAISGGFDPIHPGHIAYIEEAIKLGDWLIVILARDDQLIEKDKIAGNIKGRMPIPYEVRKTAIEWGLRGKGEVVENIDKDITSCKSLARYKPDVFAKGGDSWDIDNLPEGEVCSKLGIEIVFGVGGFDKPYSSSQLGRANPE